MTDRRAKLLFDAISAIAAATSFVTGKSLLQYEQDLLLRSAVERQLEILGEACARLAREDAEWLGRIPEMRMAIGLRNRIIQGYDAVDDETVHLTVINDLAALTASLRTALDRITGGA